MCRTIRGPSSLSRWSADSRARSSVWNNSLRWAQRNPLISCMTLAIGLLVVVLAIGATVTAVKQTASAQTFNLYSMTCKFGIMRLALLPRTTPLMRATYRAQNDFCRPISNPQARIQTSRSSWAIFGTAAGTLRRVLPFHHWPPKDHTRFLRTVSI